jgi:choline dehydrogenase-like flavoprotein
MTYLRAQKSQLDSWESLGNPGWNWESVLPYYTRSENLTIPPTQEDFEPKFHGFKGPLKVGWPSEMTRGLATSRINETWNALGLPYNEDANGGAMRGFSVWPWTVDSDTSTRQDAARAYYLPISDRSNIDVFLESTAAKITWSEEAEGNLTDLRASGVEAITKQGDRFQLSGNEILVCLGAMRTPGFLELSGIGDPR